MKNQMLKANILLFLTALIWGFAFVAQRVGMNYIGPFTFNSIRFTLGALSMLPLLWIFKPAIRQSAGVHPRIIVAGIVGAGILLFSGASLQQVGLVYTTAGKAGFITGLYVVIVPIMGVFFRHDISLSTWIGAGAAATGLYFLSVTEQFTINFGDFLEITGAFFWAGHVILLGWLSPKINAAAIAFCQYAICALLSFLTAFMFEPITIPGIAAAWLPLFYGGFLSVGIAYTLQVVAQRDAKPSHAAIILSLEAVFAAFGGWLLINEQLTLRGFAGAGLMLSGMIVSQMGPMYASRPIVLPPDPEQADTDRIQSGRAIP